MLAVVIFLYIIASYAFTSCLVFYDGFLNCFELVRRFANWLSPKWIGSILECPICTSCWVGMGFSMVDLFMKKVVFTPWNLLLGMVAPWWLIIILDTFTTCGFVMLLYHLDELIVAKTGEEVTEDEEQ